MNNADPTRTVHFRLACTRLGKLSGDGGDRVEKLVHSVRQDADPELRAHYGLSVGIAWLELTFGCTVALVVTGFAAGWLFGESGADVALAIWMALGFFCFAGAVNALWRYYWFVPQARRRAQHPEVRSELVAIAMRRTLPPDSSLVWQAAVGVLAFMIARVST